MKPDAQGETALFQAAVQLTGAARSSFLDSACQSDPALRQRLEALLAAHEQSEGVLAEVAPVAKATMKLEFNDEAKDETVGQKIGRYKILERVGEGGCGVVYVAEQTEPVRRRVALKVIKLGMDTKQVVARFEAERQALAMMDDPNIAKVLDAGTTELGRPFFVMELVRGIRITDYCDQANLSTKDRLDLFIQVCHAIQHAHQKGIIHRDIKPSNILVTLHDGVPVPKVIDFGIAKATEGRLTDATVYTQLHQFIGTPAYMSPEQAEMSGLDIDTRSDIYSLGVLLYELLAGSTPFDGRELMSLGIDVMRKTIREQEPARPSARLATLQGEELTTTARRRAAEAPKLVNQLRGDLDWIVMKCLEKDRQRRYETANGLAADLKRHLNNETVVARPPSSAYRFQKLIYRNKLAFAATGAVTVALLIGIGISVWQAVRATHAEREQIQLRELAEKARAGEAAQREQAESARANESKLRALAEANEHKAKTEAARSAEVAQFMKDMLKSVGPSVALGRDTTLIKEILNQTAERIGKDLKDQPEISAELQNTMGEVWYALGDSQKAKTVFQETLALRKRVFGFEHLLVAESLHNLAMALRSTDERAEAERTERKALEIRRKLLGNEHPAVADSLDDLGRILQYAERQTGVAEAETVHREALAIRRKLFGNKSPEVVESLKNLASVLRMHDKAVEAESNVREALQIVTNLYGHEHPQVADVLGDLAHVLGEQGRLAEAEQARRECLALRRKLLSSDHPGIYFALRNLGNLLVRGGKSGEAEATYREALVTAEKRFPDGVSLFDMQYTLGGMLLEQKRYGEAEPLLRAAYAGLQQHERELPSYAKGMAASSAQMLVQLYKSTNQPDKVAEWEKKLAEKSNLDASK